jgi:hypothetical protein
MMSGACPVWPQIDGSWKMTYRMPDGSAHESTLDLASPGGKLTGKVTSKRGTAPIEEGRLEGDKIRFTVIRRGNGDELAVVFSGTITGNSMRLKMEYRDHDPIDVAATR